MPDCPASLRFQAARLPAAHRNVRVRHRVGFLSHGLWRMSLLPLDPNEPSRMAKAADSDLGRFIRTYVVPALLGTLVFLVSQAWADFRARGDSMAADIKEQGKAIAGVAVS